MELRDMLLQELKEAVEREDALVKKYSDEISAEMFAKSTVPDGAFATTARAACAKRAEDARVKKAAIEAQSKWKKEMLSKYR
jgi:hypothetical protein